MGIDFYMIPGSPPCRTVMMTAKYLGLELNSKLVDLMAKEQLKPEFLKINPQHTVPTIDDNGFILWESRAIITYLVNKYAPDSELYPRDPQARAIVDRLLYFDLGTLFKGLAEFVYPQVLFGKPADAEKEESYQKGMTLLEGILSTSDYVAGNHVTVADLSIFSELTFTELFDFGFQDFPKVSAWMEKLKFEVPGHKEINEEPLQAVKVLLSTRKLTP